MNRLVNTDHWKIKSAVYVSFIKYRLMRIRRLSKNKVYVLIRYLIFLYVKIKIKLGWY